MLIRKEMPGVGLVDRNSVVRLAAGLGEDGSPGLFLFGEKANPRIDLKAGAADSVLSLFDKQGKERVYLGTDKNVQRLCLSDENEKSRADLSTDANGPGLLLSDENGKPRAALLMAREFRGSASSMKPEGSSSTPAVHPAAQTEPQGPASQER